MSQATLLSGARELGQLLPDWKIEPLDGLHTTVTLVQLSLALTV